MVSRAPGVGPKVALRIVNELSNKALLLALSMAAPAPKARASGRVEASVA